MNKLRQPDEIALARHQIIAEVLSALADGTDAAKISQLKSDVCQKSGISRRTLRRWLTAYNRDGFEGLRPMPRNTRPSVAIPEALIDEAVLLRREAPLRSVDQIIEILKLEGLVEKGFLRRSTLQNKLQNRGYGSSQMKLYHQKGMAARRFARKERNELWQSDIKNGPRLRIDGELKQTYLVCFLDDATRYVVHGQFYDRLDATIVEDCLRQAVLKEGVPKRVLFDNGKQYRTKWMERACALLEIKLIFAAPYSPETKGKIERFNRTVDSFLAEARLKRTNSLEEYNDWWQAWLQEGYHSKLHDGIDSTPDAAYKSSKAALRFKPADVVAKAFLRYDTRKVDKSGCISFENKKYEVGVAYIGRNIGIVFDPADTSVLTVEDNLGKTSFPIRELIIGEHTGRRPKLPERLTLAKPETSRLLDQQIKRHSERQLSAKRAISYLDMSDDSDGIDTNIAGVRKNENKGDAFDV